MAFLFRFIFTIKFINKLVNNIQDSVSTFLLHINQMIFFQLFGIMYKSLFLIKSYWKRTFIVRGMNKYKKVDSVD